MDGTERDGTGRNGTGQQRDKEAAHKFQTVDSAISSLLFVSRAVSWVSLCALILPPPHHYITQCTTAALQRLESNAEVPDGDSTYSWSYPTFVYVTCH